MPYVTRIITFHFMSRVRLDLYSNRHYRPGPIWIKALWYCVSRLIFMSFIPYPNRLKRRILKLFGANIGEGVVLKPSVQIKYPWMLSIGDFSWIGENVWIDNLDKVEIGPHCCLSQRVTLICGNHDFRSPTFDLITEPIILEEGAWIGANSTIGPGVTIGKMAVIGMGNVITKSTKSNTIIINKQQVNETSRFRDMD